MRLYLLPVSTRRTLLYCQRLQVASTEKKTLIERVQDRAAKTWSTWEKKEKGWQRSVVNYGNYALRRIPFEEWGLKSVPPLPRNQEHKDMSTVAKVEVVYPKSLLPTDKIPSLLDRLSTEREALHRRKLIWCIVGMPITAPVALIPVVPNIPFFYLLYRAWSHYRALSGGKHLQFLLQKNLLNLAPSSVLDQLYAKQALPLPSAPVPTPKSELRPEHPIPTSITGEKDPEVEAMLLSQETGKRITEALDIPQLEVELERAVWQVETAIEKHNAESEREKGAVRSGTVDGGQPRAASVQKEDKKTS